MNYDALDCSTEDEGVDEELMFDFEQELDVRMTLDDHSRPVGTVPAATFRPIRPPNPVASLLQNSEDFEFASLSASPFGEHGSPSVLRMAMGDAAPAPICERSPAFDFNGRRKRKYLDDSCCVTPRVKPKPKRAKSFSCVADVIFPTVGADATNRTNLETNTDANSSVFSKRSDSIQIPRRVMRHHRSSSGPPRAFALHRQLDAPAASSDPLVSHASSSWNASVEYFCRRSLDISSPLRLRFRDLVVGSAGRAGSLQTP